jgi:hypothetical protein
MFYVINMHLNKKLKSQVNANTGRNSQIYDQVYGKYFNYKRQKWLVSQKPLQMSGLWQ